MDPNLEKEGDSDERRVTEAVAGAEENPFVSGGWDFEEDLNAGWFDNGSGLACYRCIT